MNKIFKKGLILIIITFIGLVVFLWFDDSLTPLSKEILEYEVKHQPDDNGNVYMWCFSCKTDDVYKAGSDVVQQANELISLNGSYEDFVDGYERLKFPDENLICEKFDDECDVFKNASKIDHKLFSTDFAWVVSRYHEYLGFNHYAQQVVPDYDAPYPSYRNLIYAQNVYHLTLLVDEVNTKNQLIDKLTEELINTKNVLSKVDVMLERMILVVLVSENIEFVSQLFQRGIFQNSDLTNYIEELNLLSKHYDLSNALKRDQVIWVNAYKEKSDVSKILETKTTLNKVLARFLYKLAYKPNMTTNFITQDLEVPLTLTRLKPQLFFEQASNIVDKEEMSQFRNFIGHRSMKKVKAYPLHEYTARIHSLHNKMVLLKSLIHYGSIDAIKRNIDSDTFLYKNLFNNDLPYFKDNQYCFGSLEGIRTRPKDLCLKVLHEQSNNENTNITELKRE